MEPANFNTPPEENAEQALAYFEYLKQRDRMIYNALEKAIGEVVQIHYKIDALEADGYRKLADRLSRHIVFIQQDLDKIFSEDKIKE